MFSLLLPLLVCSSAWSANSDLAATKNERSNIYDVIARGHKNLFYNGAGAFGDTGIQLIPSLETQSFAFHIMGAGSTTGLKELPLLIDKSRNLFDYIYNHTNSYSQTIETTVAEYSAKTKYQLDKNTKSLEQQSQDNFKEVTILWKTVPSEVTIKKVTTSKKRPNKETSEQQRSWATLFREQGQNSFTDSKTVGSHHIRQFSRDLSSYDSMRSRFSTDFSSFAKSLPPWTDYSASTDMRTKYSSESLNTFKSTISYWKPNILRSLNTASTGLKTRDSKYGLNLQILKSTGWLLKALIIDAIAEPLLTTATASAQFSITNILLFPSYAVFETTKSVGQVGIKTGTFMAQQIHLGISPAAKASKSVATAVIGSSFFTSKALLNYTAAGLLQVTSEGFSHIAWAGENAVYGLDRYLLSPAWSLAEKSGTSLGLLTLGTSNYFAAKTVELTRNVLPHFSSIAGGSVATATWVGGSAIAGIGSAGYILLQTGEAAVRPLVLNLGGGLILGYHTTSQLAGHTTLAAADLSYLALSVGD